MEKEGNCQSRICTYLYLTLSFMSNDCHTQENLLVLSTSCLCITAEELEGKTRRAAVIKERWYLHPSDTCGYLQHPFGTVARGRVWSWEAHGDGLAVQLSWDSGVCCQFTLGEGKGSRGALEERPGHVLRTGPDSKHPSTAFSLLQWWNLLTQKFV